MTPEQRFGAYIAAFNAGDWARLTPFYAPDVHLIIGSGRELVGRKAIVAFYTEVRQQAVRTIHVLDCFAEGLTLAAELESEFTLLVDDPPFAGRPMKAGERYYINSLALYDMNDDGLFARVRAATLKREYRSALSV